MIKTTIQALALGISMVSVTTIAAENPLIVATDTAFVPFEFKQGEKYVGFDIDLWEAIASEMKVHYKFQVMDFSGIIPALQTNNVDIAIAGMSIKDERKKVIDFSDPYYQSSTAIMVRSDNTDIKNPSDLNGKIIGAKTGTATADWIKANIKPKKLILFPNIDNAYLDLRSGGIDAAMHDTPNVQYYIQTAGQGAVKIAGIASSGAFYGIGFPKGSPWVSKVNQALQTLKANGRYDAIYKKWFGHDVAH